VVVVVFHIGGSSKDKSLQRRLNILKQRAEQTYRGFVDFSKRQQSWHRHILIQSRF
jgi:hypothetical protein